MAKISYHSPDDDSKLSNQLGKEGDGGGTLDMDAKLGKGLAGAGADALDEGVSIASKAFSFGGMFLDALGPIGDIAMMGSMAYSAVTEKDEGAEAMNAGNKIHAQLQQLGQGASISEGSMAGSVFTTNGGSVGASFPHF